MPPNRIIRYGLPPFDAGTKFLLAIWSACCVFFVVYVITINFL